jgi:hypothetical protein
MTRNLALLVTLALATTTASASEARPTRVTLQQLVATPKKFNGRDVSVVGYYDHTQEHSPFLARDIRSAHSTEANNIESLIFVALKPSQLKDPAIKAINRGYIRIVGTFEYKSTQGRSLGPDRKNSGRFIWQSSLGFGWGGIYSMQMTNIKEFTPVSRR